MTTQKTIKNYSTLEKQLNIAMIGHKRIPSREGGIEVVVENISTRLVKLGHKVTAYNRKGHHVSGKEFNNKRQHDKKNFKGVRLIFVPTIECKGLAALTASFFSTLHAVFKKYDCIHYHAEGPAVMLILPYLLGIRTVVTIHGLDWQRAKWGTFAKKYLKFGEKMAAQYADEVIVLSKNVQQYFKDTYNRDTVFIPNGINKSDIFEAQLIKEKWQLEKDNYILYLGRIVPEKGIQYLIDAFCNMYTSKKLVIAGGASDTDSFMKELMQKAKINNGIIFTGFVQGKVLKELYSNAYIYVLPSDLEGMPISLLEAMSYGNCCLTSDIPECKEVSGEAGITFKHGNVQELQNQLQYLINSPEIVMKYKKISSENICANYNWDEIVNDTLKLYR